MTRKELLKNLWDFTPEQIAEAVRNGVVTEYELKTQAHGQYTPMLRRKVSTLLKAGPAQSAPAVNDAPAQPVPAIAPQPVFEQSAAQPVVQPAVQPQVQPAPKPFAERTVIAEQPAPVYQEPQAPIYPEPAMNQQYGTPPPQPEQWGTPPPSPTSPPPTPQPGEFVYSHGEDKKGGFASLFSFYGRIGRLDYFMSMLAYGVLYGVIYGIMFAMLESGRDVAEFAFIPALFLIPLYWFGLAQSVKRCHDLGHSGWWQLIPFFGFWLLFAAGQNYPNKYGPDRIQ